MQINIQVDAQDRDGNSALHIAARQNDLESVRVILTFGANPHLMNRANKKPMDYVKDPEIRALIAGTDLTILPFTERSNVYYL